MVVPVKIPLADDDLQDIFLVQEAFKASKLKNDLITVNDGQELVDYLARKGKYSDSTLYPIPDIILLDLNMPRMNGIEALEIIKKSKNKSIPIIILTTSESEKDIVDSYELGVNSYIVKPVDFKKLVEIVTSFNDYWVQIVKLPKSK